MGDRFTSSSLPSSLPACDFLKAFSERHLYFRRHGNTWCEEAKTLYYLDERSNSCRNYTGGCLEEERETNIDSLEECQERSLGKGAAESGYEEQ